jgi:hypothetical protein
MQNYSYLIFIEPNAKFDLTSIKTVISELPVFINKNAQIQEKENTLIISTKGWNIKITTQNEDYVNIEAQEIALIYKRPVLAFCKSRIEIHTDDDPDDIFYNEQLILIEAFYNIPHIHIFDPFWGKFLN